MAAVVGVQHDEAVAGQVVLLAGEPLAAAACWRAIGDRFQVALCLADSDDPQALAEAREITAELGAEGLAARVRRRMRELGLFVSISSGVKAGDYAVIDRLAADGVGADYITIDIAHGHADTVKNMIAHIKEKLPSTFIIAGNVGTPEAIIDL